jgi:hypothetical protein
MANATRLVRDRLSRHQLHRQQRGCVMGRLLTIWLCAVAVLGLSGLIAWGAIAAIQSTLLRYGDAWAFVLVIVGIASYFAFWAFVLTVPKGRRP